MGYAVSVAPPLTLAAYGSTTAQVPTDVVLKATGRFTYALFLDEKEQAPSAMVHALTVDLPLRGWRWEMETWARPESLAYAKRQEGGNYWTVQIMPVIAATDWFSELLQVNGRETPDFWLAKRWSSTPQEITRVVAEYREPAPACMQKRLREAASSADSNSFPLKGKELWRDCTEEVEAFSRRADAAVALDKADMVPGQALLPLQQRPSKAPDMGKLAGRAENELKGRSDSSYP